MDPSVIIAIISLVGSVGGIWVANRYTARTARDAQAQARALGEQTAEIERKKLDQESWRVQVDSWRADVAQLRELRMEDQQRHEIEMQKMQSRLDATDEQLRLMMRERAFDRAHIEAMVAWGRVVVSMMRTAGIAYPPPPPGVTDTLPPGAIPPVTG
jgi:hypothetical protein